VLDGPTNRAYIVSALHPGANEEPWRLPSRVFNQNKSVCIMVSKNQHKPIEQLTLGIMTLEWVNSFKYIGLIPGVRYTLIARKYMVNVTAF